MLITVIRRQVVAEVDFRPAAKGDQAHVIVAREAAKGLDLANPRGDFLEWEDHQGRTFHLMVEAPDTLAELEAVTGHRESRR